jgi:Tol biopolymer transport system component
MALVYTGNTNGRFLPGGAQGALIGGLARRASVIEQLRSQFPLNMVIDGGNFLTETSLPVKARLADWFFGRCAYDAVGLGGAEVDYGVDRLFSKTNPPNYEYCCANISGASTTGIVRSKTITVKGYSVYLISAIGPAAPKRPSERAVLSAPIGEVTALLSKSAAKNAVARILILNDTWQNIRSLAQALPEIDIILCGGLSQKFETPMKIGNALLLSPGANGECVGKLILRFNDQKQLVSFDNHLISLTEDILPDSAVAAKLRSAIESGEITEQPMEEPFLKKSPTSGVFAFLSDRDGAPQLYLKMPEKQAEFKLTGNARQCMKPTLSFASGKCAYFEKTADTACPVLRTMDISGVQKKTLPLSGCVSEAIFSPDGKWLYCSGRIDSSGEGLFRIKPEGTGFQTLITWKNASERYIDLSPLGVMVFGSNGNGKSQLYITDSVGRKPICFTEGASDNISPLFSPTGEYCAFLSNKTSFGGSYDLWIYALASGKVGQITYNAKVNEFCWLNDGKTMICSSGDHSATLKTVDIVSKESTRLIEGDSIMAYSERTPKLLALKSFWKIIYTREYSNGDRKIFWVNINGSGEQRIVNSKGRDWLE